MTSTQGGQVLPDSGAMSDRGAMSLGRDSVFKTKTSVSGRPIGFVFVRLTDMDNIWTYGFAWLFWWVLFFPDAAATVQVVDRLRTCLGQR